MVKPGVYTIVTFVPLLLPIFLLCAALAFQLINSYHSIFYLIFLVNYLFFIIFKNIDDPAVEVVK